jgi:hypothetical protein
MLPPFTQLGNAQGALQLGRGIARQVKQRVYLRDANAFRAIHDFYNFVAGSDGPLFQYPKVETGSVMRDHQGRHLRFVHADTEPITSNPRL